MSTSKVSIIGGGKVGMTAAFTMFLQNTARELVLYDRNTDKMKGEQLEFQDSLAFSGTTNIIAASSTDDLRDSDVIIYTTGIAQETGQSRLDLAKKNTQIMTSILPEVVNTSPNSVVLIVTNPVDILTYEASKLLKLAKGKVFGSGTCLDTARFRFHLSEILKVNPKNIHAYILGEHGDSSFPAISQSDIGGQPLMEIAGITKEQVQEAYVKTRNTAETIIAAKGATYYAIGVVINQLVGAVNRDTKRIYPVSVSLSGEYGFTDVSISVPCVIGKNGVERILVIPLTEEEKLKMSTSVHALKNLIV